MSNPFTGELDDFRGHEVVVESEDGDTFRGWCRLWDYGSQSLILLDATRLKDDVSDEYVGKVYVRRPMSVRFATPTGRVEALPPEEIALTPWSQRDFSGIEFHHYVTKVQDWGRPGSYPVVRERDPDEYEMDQEPGLVVVDGNKRVAASRAANVDRLPVRVLDMDPWEALQHWVHQHIGLKDTNPDRRGPTQEWYDDVMVDAVIDELLERGWTRARLEELPQLAHHFQRRDHERTTPAQQPELPKSVRYLHDE